MVKKIKQIIKVRSLHSLCSVGMTILFIFLSFGVSAGVTTAVYNAHGAGMHLISGEQVIKTDGKHIDIRMETQTRGLLSLLLDAQTVFATNLDIEAGECLVKSASMTSIEGKTIREREFDFKTCPGYVDYQTAMYDLMQQKEPKTRTYNVFDSRRKMKITFTYQGAKELKSSSRMMYAGPADYYTVTIDVIEGKKKGWFFNRVKDKEDSRLHAYLARVGDEKVKRLVLGEFETTLFGTISVYLGDLK